MLRGSESARKCCACAKPADTTWWGWEWCEACCRAAMTAANQAVPLGTTGPNSWVAAVADFVAQRKRGAA